MTQDAVPAVVLDTNVVLDWLVFRNPVVAPLAAALAAGELRWIACLRMRDELSHVLARGLAAARSVEPGEVLSRWDEGTTLLEAPLVAPAQRLHCTDPDDQVFIDLAQSAGARWLLSRDRALLKLARRARAFDVEVTTPERWQLPLQ